MDLAQLVGGQCRYDLAQLRKSVVERLRTLTFSHVGEDALRLQREAVGVFGEIVVLTFVHAWRRKGRVLALRRGASVVCVLEAVFVIVLNSYFVLDVDVVVVVAVVVVVVAVVVVAG